MPLFYRIKAIGTLLIISSLLILLFGCEKNGSVEKADEGTNHTTENIDERIKIENDRLIKDRPEEEELEGAEENTV